MDIHGINGSFEVCHEGPCFKHMQKKVQKADRIVRDMLRENQSFAYATTKAQICSNCTADQRLCFCYTDCTILLRLKSKISSFKPLSVTVQAGLYRTWSETQKIDFLASRLICGSL